MCDDKDHILFEEIDSKFTAALIQEKSKSNHLTMRPGTQHYTKNTSFTRVGENLYKAQKDTNKFQDNLSGSLDRLRNKNKYIAGKSK
jgi:hypothetical protein